MFGRTIEMNVVKKHKTAKSDDFVLEHPPVDYALIVRETTETVAKYVAIGVAGYVALDTIRQVLVKLTPQH